MSGESGLFRNVVINPPPPAVVEEPVNTELLADDEVEVKELTLEPNSTERTWEAFDARWNTLQTEAAGHKDDIMNHMLAISREFNLQQLDSAANSFALAFAELEKCIFYEQNALVAEIGPRPVVEVVEEPIVEDEPVITPEPAPVP